MRKSCEARAKGILIGNRCHLSHLRQVQPEEGKNLAEHLEMPLYKTSTEKNINIDECFDELVDSLLEEIERGPQLKELNTLLLPASGQEDKAVHVNCCDWIIVNIVHIFVFGERNLRVIGQGKLCTGNYLTYIIMLLVGLRCSLSTGLCIDSLAGSLYIFLSKHGSILERFSEGSQGQ